MALNPNNLLTTATGLGSGLRVFPTSVQPKTFKLGSGTLAKLAPLQFEDASGQWIEWPGGTSEINVITADATVATDGTFILTITKGGIEFVIPAIDHDVSTSALDTLITNALGLAAADLVVTEGGGGLDANNGTCTLTWAAEMGEQNIIISADFSGLTGNVHVLSTSQAGVAGRIDGFVWPDAVVLDADEEVLGQVMLGGRIHAGDLIAATSASVGAVRAACADKQLRDSGFIFEGLADFH